MKNINLFLIKSTMASEMEIPMPQVLVCYITNEGTSNQKRTRSNKNKIEDKMEKKLFKKKRMRRETRKNKNQKKNMYHGYKNGTYYALSPYLLNHISKGEFGTNML
jgi:hypothetical protein